MIILKNRVRQLANVKNRSPHLIMCEGIRDYVQREEAKEEFKQEALASWAAYKILADLLTICRN
jgi:predicted transcriptional regulator